VYGPAGTYPYNTVSAQNGGAISLTSYGNSTSLFFNQDGSLQLENASNTFTFEVDSSGNIISYGGSLSTNGGTDTWKFGAETTATSVFNTTKYLNVTVDGTAYKLALCV
jgi:hypothetical protein